jgi:hypothetical protein
VAEVQWTESKGGLVYEAEHCGLRLLVRHQPDGWSAAASSERVHVVARGHYPTAEMARGRAEGLAGWMCAGSGTAYRRMHRRAQRAESIAWRVLRAGAGITRHLTDLAAAYDADRWEWRRRYRESERARREERRPGLLARLLGLGDGNG